MFGVDVELQLVAAGLPWRQDTQGAGELSMLGRPSLLGQPVSLLQSLGVAQSDRTYIIYYNIYIDIYIYLTMLLQ